MSCCYIFNKSLLMDSEINSASINIRSLQSIIPAYSSDTSGIWQPIIIGTGQTTLTKVDFLTQAGDFLTANPFDPLSCTSQNGQTYEALLVSTSLNCDYCKEAEPLNFSSTWQLKDKDGNKRKIQTVNGIVEATITSDCCSGACDTRMKYDDFIPKIPVLNQNYLKKFYDFKYLKQFPATTNPGLGFDEFIKIYNISSFDIAPHLVIDWRIKDTISEITYDKLTSPYSSSYQHNKALKKSKIVSQTCGNFILTKANPDYTGLLPTYSLFSGLIGDPDQTRVPQNIQEILPSVSDFDVPYGFDKSTYNNIFIKNKKLASYWKWDYESGVLCWYRYYNKDKIDDRPIQGVDLYISPGDVFYAKNQGPEPPPVASSMTAGGYDTQIKSCPSGLKVLESGSIACVIPSGSSFTYISKNLYPKFLDIYDKLSVASITDEKPLLPKDKFELAALLCTAPEYDKITVDLMLRNKKYEYNTNKYFQIDILNKYMLKGTSYGSAGKLNYIKNKTDLINTLADKYGAYLWCPPNVTTIIKIKDPIKSQCLVDLDFDIVALKRDIQGSETECSVTTDCSSNIAKKTFAYGQKFSLGQTNLEFRLDTKTRYSNKCINGQIQRTHSSKIAGFYLNNSLIKEIPYDSGCYIFQDNYPRILTPNTPTDSCCNNSGIDCTVCDADSTYNLVGGGSALCKNFQGELSWCDKTQANYYNNNNYNNFSNRPIRNILNNTLYFKRSYPVTIFDPHIDSVAFHHQGGIYYSHSVSGSPKETTVFAKGISNNNDGDLRISFTTKDIGIKIYSVVIEKLRDNEPESYSCRAFPIKDKCKCFGLTNLTELPYVCNTNGPITFTNDPILYTPNISTRFSPQIKAYGGYTQERINEMLGGGEISNKIKVLQKEIESLNKTIDFMELAGLSYDTNGNSLDSFKNTRLEKSGKIDSLKNELSEYRIPNHPDPGVFLPTLAKYINPLKPYGEEQSVSINLNNYVTTTYSVQLPSYDTSHADIWAQVSENIDFTLKRYATKVLLNENTTIYDQQRKKITSNYINIKLSNPYLEALLGNEYILYPPAGSLCSKSGNFGSSGDEISSINLTFYRIPRQQMLNFFIKSPKPMGFLKKGFFHPNSGLIYREQSDAALTPLEKDTNNNIFLSYDKKLFYPDAPFSDSGVVYYGEINDTLKRVMQQIQGFSEHRKPRLYLQLNGLWYEYKTANLFGFYNHNTLYIGEPNIFEYLDDERAYSTTGPWIPVSAKTHIDFNFIYNYPNPNEVINITYQQPTIIINPKKPQEITLDGTRSYFFVLENDSATNSLSDSIANLSDEDMNSISNEKPELVLANKDRYRYINGPKNQRSSYIISDYNYLYHNFSDLHIDYNKKNKSNYIYNTKKKCNQKITIISASNPEQNYDARIIEKKLYSIYIDQYGNKLNYNDPNKKYIKIYTQFTLDTPLKYEKAFIDFSCLSKDFSNAEGVDSLIVYQNVFDSQALKKENDQFLYNNKIQSKWGDLINYDPNTTNELTKYFINNRYINNVYPSSLYSNNFFKMIVNNGNNSNHNFVLKLYSNTIRLELVDNIYFNIHQKHNVDYGSYQNGYDFWNSNNYLPYIDINILPTGNDINSSRSALKNYPLKYNSSGIINISGIYKRIDSTHDWKNYIPPSEGKYFWLNLDVSGTMLAAISPTRGFFSDSMRIDHPTFQLNKINYSTQNSLSNTNCRLNYNPSINTNSILFNSNTFNFSHFSTKTTGSIFDIFPIYCDKDRVSGCSNVDCSIATVGTGSYSGEYTLAMHKTENVPINNNNIPYIISYDAGLYNPIGNMSLSYITRHELSATNSLYTSSVCDSDFSPRPANYSNSILNEEYQSIMRDSIINDHKDIVKYTDSMANEMLFRLLYGEQQKINYERIDNTINDRVKLEDLFRYVYPKTEPKDLYKNIQYDMDITADCSNRKINGSISVDGILGVNKTTTVTIDNKTILLSIESNTNNGTIDIVASCDDKKHRSILHRIKNISQQIVVATNELQPANSNETYTLVATCKERRQLDIYLTNKITRAEINTDGCSIDENNNKIKVKAYFPYWKYEGIFASSETGEASYPEGKSCTFYEGGPLGGCGSNDLDIYFINHGTCNAQGGYAFPFTECTNRGVGPVKVPENCNEITRVQAANMKITEYSRSVMPSDVCHIGGSITEPQNDGPNVSIGPIESFVSTVMLDDPIGISLNPRYQTNTCGTCFTLDSKSWSDNDTYNKFGRDFPVTPVSTSDSCECAPYTYGYCRNSQDAASCACSTLNYNDYTEFDYTFGYCNYSITLKGHKRRQEGKLKNPEIIKDSIATNFCDPVAGKATAYKYSNISDDPNLTITEECLWYYCNRTEPTKYYIHNKTTITDAAPYNPSCPQSLCNILYDNNKITVSLGGSSSGTLCVPISIRNNCPKITITVPDDSYKVTDSIESECADSSVDNNQAIMIDQHPSWDIITETRTCVLGYILQGNPNENGPVGDMGGGIVRPCGVCNFCPKDSCVGNTTGQRGYGLCGKNAPDSYPWHICISKLKEGYVCIKGNYHDRWGNTTNGYTGYPSVIGCDIPVNYPIETSNPQANELYVREWESNMRQLYDNISACNTREISSVFDETQVRYNLNRTYNISDIVEGVVPNSCSELKFTNLYYPGIKFRTGLNDPIVQDHTVIVKVAYYTYSYRRPRNIQDILKGEEISKKCNELATLCDNNSLRITSNYITKDCDTSPNCYNTSTQKCTNTNYCCKTGKISYE